MIKRFLNSGKTGFYFRVAREGEVGAGDMIELISIDEKKALIADMVRLYKSKY